VLLNDDDHSYDYVIEMLQRLFCFSVQQAYEHAVEVDSKQRTVLITCGLAEAEFGRDQVLAYGPDPRIPHCKGSMSAVVEPPSNRGAHRYAHVVWNDYDAVRPLPRHPLQSLPTCPDE
jgi:ATP-dependent Clp protease adaptor protein ClpS